MDRNAGSVARLCRRRTPPFKAVGQIDRRHDFIEYHRQKYYNFRVAALTRAQVEEMMLAQVGSPLAIENAHRNLLDMEDDE